MTSPIKSRFKQLGTHILFGKAEKYKVAKHVLDNNHSVDSSFSKLVIRYLDTYERMKEAAIEALEYEQRGQNKYTLKLSKNTEKSIEYKKQLYNE